MKRISHRMLSASLLLLAVNFLFAQNTDVESLQETARSLMRQGDFENATLVLNKALQLKPDDLNLQKDEAFISYLKRDFASAIETGKKITAREDADIQSFQILGLAYKATADYKESDKMYKTALKKFPNSGVLYSEYGELLESDNNDAAAIRQWEKGIEMDANYSGNYYYAGKHYAVKGNMVWGLLYGEIFVNIESLSARTGEIKDLLFKGYQKLFSQPESLNTAKQSSKPFEKAIATEWGKLIGLMKDGVTPGTLTAFKTRFILNWYHGPGREFPCRLFEQHRLFLQEGFFEAYNQWLIGAIADTQKYQQWTQDHPDEIKSFQQYQGNVIFKIPEGQYYNR